jgi:hypothetical protein
LSPQSQHSTGCVRGKSRKSEGTRSNPRYRGHVLRPLSGIRDLDATLFLRADHFGHVLSSGLKCSHCLRFRSTTQWGRLREMRRGRKPKGKPARSQRTIVVRKKSASGRNIQLYGLAYSTAWGRISPHQKREQPNLALWLHASIRRQLKEGATDPFSIAFEALKAIAERSDPGTP